MAATPAAGWYADPIDASVQRWWDGTQWTSHVQPVPAPPPVAAVPPYGGTTHAAQPTATAMHGFQPGPAAQSYPAAGSPHPLPAQPMHQGKKKHGLYNAEVDLANGKNTPAKNALILGILCLLVNPFILPSIAAIVWGGIGLTRANMYENRGYTPIGRKNAAWGMGLGIVGLLASMILKGFMF